MKRRFITISVLLIAFIAISLTPSACCKTRAYFYTTVTDHNGSPTIANNSPGDSGRNETSDAKKGSRDNKPSVFIGTADGIVTYGNNLVTIDASHIDDGYIMAAYTGENPKVKLQTTGPDGITYTYDLHGDYETFPLTAGNGDYQLAVYENIKDSSYSTLFTHSIPVTISNEFGPYLYANQYVDFHADSTPVQQAALLAAPADSDIEVIQNIYNYIITNYTYDYTKADQVSSDYLPDVDEIYNSRTGICFDFAAVMAAMLRTQNIPTRLEIGYIEDIYHAWISTYVNGTGWINGIIKFDGTSWELMDPTFAVTSPHPMKFIADDDSYITKYIY